MTVNLATDVGLESTAPEPVPESRAPTAPVIADTPGVPDPSPAEYTPPEPVPTLPLPRPTQVDRPAPTPKPTPTPTPKPTSKPRPTPKPTSKPKPRPTTKQPSSSKPKPSTAKPVSKPASKPGGGSRIGKDFLGGAGSSTTSKETRPPASAIGASVKNSLFGSVTRQIKPHWTPPSGPDVEKIVTKVRFKLNSDGSLSGTPSVVSQTGINATNKAQAQRHGEQAVRAVRLAAPFNGLPDQYYNAWKTVTITFDWKL